MEIFDLSIEIDMKGFTMRHEFISKGRHSATLLDAYKFIFELGSLFLVFINGWEFLKEGIVVIKQWRSRFEEHVNPLYRATMKTRYDERTGAPV